MRDFIIFLLGLVCGMAIFHTITDFIKNRGQKQNDI